MYCCDLCAACFYWLRQLRQVRRSLDDESVRTLVHAFVTARVDYCNMVLAGSPRSVTDRLQPVLNAAVRLVIGTRKYDRGLSQLLHADLHWLDVAGRVRYKLVVTVHQCLHNKAPKYLTDCCVADSDIAGRRRLQCAQHIVASWTYRVIEELHSVVRRSLSLDQPSGLHFQSSSEMRLRTLSGSH